MSRSFFLSRFEFFQGDGTEGKSKVKRDDFNNFNAAARRTTRKNILLTATLSGLAGSGGTVPVGADRFVAAGICF